MKYLRKSWVMSLSNEEFEVAQTYIQSYRDIKKYREEEKEPLIKYSTPIPLPLNFAVETDYHGDDLFDTLQCVPTPQKQWSKQYDAIVAECNKNKEHNMSNTAIYNSTVGRIDSTVPTDQKQRDYTLGRLRDIKDQKYTDLRKQFGLVDDDAPVTFEDLMARIQAGKFIFPEDKKQKHYGIWSILDIIRWRDPAVKEDQDGFNKASGKLDEAYTAARDQTVLDVPTQGLKIIEDFKSLKLS